jgi:hypothetical protein
MKHVGSEKHAGSKARQARRKAGQTGNKGSKRSGRHENKGRHPPVRPPTHNSPSNTAENLNSESSRRVNILFFQK